MVEKIYEYENLSKVRHDPFVTLQVLFMLEKSKGRDSRWAQWFDVMPMDFQHLPSYYDNKDIDYLVGTKMHDDVTTHRLHIRTMYRLAKQHLFDLHPETFPEEIYNEKEFTWAYHVIESRIRRVEGVHYLVPMLGF